MFRREKWTALSASASTTLHTERVTMRFARVPEQRVAVVAMSLLARAHVVATPARHRIVCQDRLRNKTDGEYCCSFLFFSS